MVCRLVVKKADARMNLLGFFKVGISYCFTFARDSHVVVVVLAIVVSGYAAEN